MNRTICIAICLIGIVLSECKTTSRTSTAVVSAPAPVSVKPPAPDSAAMAIADGLYLYQTKCNGCHDLPRVSDYSPDDWPNIMVKMSRKAHLTDLESAQVMAYINNKAKQ